MYNHKVKLYCNARKDLENLFDIKGGLSKAEKKKL